MANSEAVLNFKELTTSFVIDPRTGTFAFNNIGGKADFTANLFAPDTNNLRDDSAEILGTKTANLTVIAQLGNGDFIADVEETITLPNGVISTEGLFNIRRLEAGETQTVSIVDGTGDFEELGGVENITQPQLNIFDVVDISLRELKAINGTDGNDNLRGTKADELINGDDGDDRLNGGFGNDVITGGNGSDVILGGAGDDTLAADLIDRFDGLESQLRGNNGNDVIYGGSKNDTLKGGRGDDLLFGKNGDDLILGGNGFDLLNGGLGDDTLRGQGGIDVADYSDLPFGDLPNSIAGVDVNLNHNRAKHSSTNNFLDSTDILRGIENVIGTSRNDRFIGDRRDNVFYGLSEIGSNTEFVDNDGDTYSVTGDVVEYDGDLSEFTFGVSESPFLGLTITKDDIGTDTLIDVEFLKFDDVLVETDDFFSILSLQEFVTSSEGNPMSPDSFTSDLVIPGRDPSKLFVRDDGDTLFATKEATFTQEGSDRIVTETITFENDGSTLTLSGEIPNQPSGPLQLEIVSGTGRFAGAVGVEEVTPASPFPQPGDDGLDSFVTLGIVNITT